MEIPQSTTAPPATQARATFVEHRVPRDGHALYAKEYPGAGPTFVMLHGYPDNHHIYDLLAQVLAEAGRHVIIFDFLGFGSSDKPVGFEYGYAQQVDDLRAVVDFLGLDKIVPVAHDAGGMTAINYLLSETERVGHLVLLNTFYSNAPTLRAPELVQFFADPRVNPIAQKMAEDPDQMAFLLTFQQTQFKAESTPAQKRVIDEVVRPIIMENFSQTPSTTSAFAKIVGALLPQITQNTALIPQLKELSVPCSIIWGKTDTYLNVGVAEDFAATFKGASLHLLDGGHWPQLDVPKEVGRLLLMEVGLNTAAV